MKENKSLEVLEARYQHAKQTNAIGFTLSGIKLTPTVTTRISELQSAGATIQTGVPSVIYF